MDLLVMRGNILRKGKADKIQELDKEIKASTSMYDIKGFKRPVSCYITFSTQEAQMRCLRSFGTSNDMFNRTVWNDLELSVLGCSLPII